MPNRYYGYYYYHPLLSFLSLSLSLLFMFDEWVLENRYRNQIYLTMAEAKTFKYLVLNGNISPENMGMMDMMVLKV